MSYTTTNDSNYKTKDTTAKAASYPVVSTEKPSEIVIKPQISAPSHLNYLKDNPAPPFKLPGKKRRTRIVVGTILSEEEAVDMIEVMYVEKFAGFRIWCKGFLVKKNVIDNFNISERDFLINLLIEMIDYAAQRDFSAYKLACFITIYLDTHLNFKWSYCNSPTAVWEYFKEMMIRHTIEDSPDGEEVFEPEESYDILTHFHTLYLSNLPLVHIVTFGVYRIKFTWPFKKK